MCVLRDRLFTTDVCVCMRVMSCRPKLKWGWQKETVVVGVDVVEERVEGVMNVWKGLNRLMVYVDITCYPSVVLFSEIGPLYK